MLIENGSNVRFPHTKPQSPASELATYTVFSTCDIVRFCFQSGCVPGEAGVQGCGGNMGVPPCPRIITLFHKQDSHFFCEERKCQCHSSLGCKTATSRFSRAAGTKHRRAVDRTRRNAPSFMELEASLPRTKNPATGAHQNFDKTLEDKLKLFSISRI